MRLIACVDDRGGMAFHQRRQSRDRVVRQHILADASGGRLWMNAYSAGQFSPEEREGLLVAEDFHYKLLRIGLNAQLESLNGFQEARSHVPNPKLKERALVVSQYWSC